MQIQGIYDVNSRILTIGSSKAFRINSSINELNTEQRLSKLIKWARLNSHISKNSVIAEI